jgi:hypothetical protein
MTSHRLSCLTTQVGGALPPLTLRRPHQFYDRVPDRRRQSMPPCDQFPECHSVPTPFRQLLRAVFITSVRKNGLRQSSDGCNSRRPNVPFEERRTPSCRFARTAGTSLGPCDRWSASDDPGLDGCPAASRRNGRIVELGSLAVGSRAARLGKNLVRRLAVRAQCDHNRSHES